MRRGFPYLYLSSVTIYCIVLLVAQLGVQATPTSIDSSFNDTSIPSTIPDPLTIWFTNRLTSVSGAVGPVAIYIQNQTVTFTSPFSGTSYTLNLPNAEITIDSNIGSPSTNFNTSTGTWLTSVSSAANNPFLTGYAWDIPAGEDPSSSNPVTWAGDVSASQAGVTVKWQWASAVYTQFSTDYNALGVTPTNGAGGYAQSGTPVNYTTYVTQGAGGYGDPNFTGSNSGIRTEFDISVVPEPGSALLVTMAGCLALLLGRRPTKTQIKK